VYEKGQNIKNKKLLPFTLFVASYDCTATVDKDYLLVYPSPSVNTTALVEIILALPGSSIQPQIYTN
jgi:hypothetical protein